jgi:hypothetical protein
MWGLALDLKITAGRKRSNLKMSDEPKKVFEAIARDYKNRGKAARVISTSCQDILENKVPPALRDAREAIKEVAPNKFIFDDAPEELSILAIVPGQDSPDELRFQCQGNEFRAIITTAGKSLPHSFMPATSEGADTLIAGAIENFLRLHLGVPRSNRN